MSKMLKKGVAVAICLCMILSCGVSSIANESSTSNGTEYSVVINGHKMVFDQSPILKDERILVPMRAIFEVFGAEIEWNSATKTVTASVDKTTIVLKIGKSVAYINSMPYDLDVPACIEGDRTMVPVRFVSEALGAAVTWNCPVVYITTSDPEAISLPGELGYQIIITDPVTDDQETSDMGNSDVILNPDENNNQQSTENTATTVENKTSDSTQTTENKTTETTKPANSDDINYGPGYYSGQEGIKGACYITSTGMIATNLTGKEYPASAVYVLNGNSVYGGTDELFAKLGIKRDGCLTLTGMTNEAKIKKVVSLLKENPEGVIVKFESSVTTHFIVVRGYIDGKLIVNDPAVSTQKYLPLDQTWTGYSMFSSYDSAIANMVRVEYYSVR